MDWVDRDLPAGSSSTAVVAVVVVVGAAVVLLLLLLPFPIHRLPIYLSIYRLGVGWWRVALGFYFYGATTLVGVE